MWAFVRSRFLSGVNFLKICRHISGGCYICIITLFCVCAIIIVCMVTVNWLAFCLEFWPIRLGCIPPYNILFLVILYTYHLFQYLFTVLAWFKQYTMTGNTINADYQHRKGVHAMSTTIHTTAELNYTLLDPRKRCTVTFACILHAISYCRHEGLVYSLAF